MNDVLNDAAPDARIPKRYLKEELSPGFQQGLACLDQLQEFDYLSSVSVMT